MDPASSRSNSSFLRSYDPSSNHFASDVIIQVPKAVSMTGTDPQMACGGNWSSVDSRSSGHQDWRVMNYTSNHKPTCSTTAGEVLSNNLNNDKIVRCVNYSSGSSMQYAMRQLPSQDHQIYQTSNDTLLDVVTNSAASIRAGCDQTVPQYISNGYSGHELDLNAYHQGGLSLSLSSKAVGIQQPSTGTSTYILHGTGPLGPFTGYAAILKSSRFLKPAQDLLDEICNAGSSRHTRPCQVHKRNSGDAVLATSGVENVDCADTAYNVTAEGESTSSAVVRSTLYTFNENRSGVDGAGSSKHESYRREYKQNKAKLIFLQEEVCGRYKQYHQQMQLLASSFQSVAGLSTATPYLSFALNNVSGDFESLRHAISDQLKNVTTEQGTTDIGKDDTICCDISRLSRATFQMHNKVAVAGAGAAGSNVGILEPQQHVWRPQRGLPERAVAILRAWLFEHFLHPYPTDTDKHMLATQTGLSRNQVSNWFINARVRVWKPMVEEIHMLETKGLADKNQNPGASTEASSDRNTNRCLNKVGGTTGTRYSVGDGQQVLNVNNWNHERKSMVEVQATGGAEGSIVDLLSYQRSGIDVGGLGAVSLTLGLRHEVENANQQHHRQHQDHYRRQLGIE